MADKHHITGKPTDLMRQLVRICEPSGIILDPFAGSGSTLVAAMMEGYDWLGTEVTPEYFSVAQARIASAVRSPQI
jgi:site-specific DNA-methyltransferase (adenine-specific)